MDPIARRRLPKSGLEVTQIGFGAAPIGNFLKPITEETSAAMISAAWDAGVRYFDTAPLYGHGLSELRLGQGLRWYPRDEFVVSSKVGRRLVPARRDSIDYAPWVNAGPFKLEFDVSYDGTMRAFEDSLQRMAIERIDILFIHDIDRFNFGDEQPEVFEKAMNGSAKAILKLRDEGVVKAVGLGVNEWQVCHESLKRHDFDCFLLAGRYTLLEQEALDGFLPLCEERGASVVLGGGYNSGILATGAVPGAKYNYKPAPEPIMERVRRIEAVCQRHQVPLKAAALQFVLGHPAIVANIPGTRTVAQLEENLAIFRTEIPQDFWADLKKEGLVREDAPVPE
ncbi:aldo/keto reductase [Geminicoccus roseus]|uniref:aldo/keto reductase n=1 Tax=Geminicoccus roseus TaxID=404900 RepID=UPI000412846C|nr:aldo/keto reductase [Geminicoccus roseus]